ncbi:MAG: hypothetical protein ACLR4Z_14430 [Butyricicoccaceae bacterium]
MMKKKTVRLISGAVAGILVGAMLVSVVASGIVYAGAASSAELKDKLSSLEDQKAEIKKELDSTASKVSDVEKTRAALQKEITLTKEEIETVKAYIERLQQQIDVKSTELESAQKALEAKEEEFLADRPHDLRAGRHQLSRGAAQLVELLRSAQPSRHCVDHHGRQQEDRRGVYGSQGGHSAEAR